jgi:hypothetical protein
VGYQWNRRFVVRAGGREDYIYALMHVWMDA